jgi:aspartate/methionine/tyrosine aminotransferase
MDRLPLPAISSRAQSLGTENAFVVLAEVNQLIRTGRDSHLVLHRQPDFPTPANIQDAAIAAIREGKHGYTPSAGIDPLREAAAREINRMRGLTERHALDADGRRDRRRREAVHRVRGLSVTDFGRGDEVIYPVPGFRSTIADRRAWRRARSRSTCASRAISPSIRTSSSPRSRAKTKLLILNTPHNPDRRHPHARDDLAAIAQYPGPSSARSGSMPTRSIRG